MEEARFDLTYRGEVLPEADPLAVRARLAAAFKLDPAGIERLFDGHPVVVKRDVDASTRARYQELFHRAGARLIVTARPAAPLQPRPNAAHADRQPVASDRPTTLALADSDDFLEAPRTVNIDLFDTSELSLVEGQNWTLADCEPPPTPIPIPDLTHLTLAEMEPVGKRGRPDD
ncbi:hypothetical protein CKO25_08190 [Thiocapsa imhoffii]|uniref:Uncharacterized protein n=1 Tax=Thiocapsa imhoffii TaxID=382777 RepID=A0A9X1B8U7_9GAMM|nr:hypothetical protein [Thiocapsa imhoffii]MBK1644628.1 hypothetical protein [Thiocapsa imhoffii]